MRLDQESLRALPLWMQEQVAMALISETGPAAVLPVEPQRVPVRKIRFLNPEVKKRYLELRTLSDYGRIQDLTGHKGMDGRIDAFSYIILEEYRCHT